MPSKLNKAIVRSGIASIALLSMSCSSKVSVRQEILPHAIALQGDGTPFSLQSRDIPAGQYWYEKHLNSIVSGLRSSKSDHILIFVHGGMVPIKTSLKDATEQILDHDQSRDYWKDERIYPIYVNWESGMSKAYADHLWRIRQGTVQKVAGPLTAPLYFVADAGRAVLRLPITATWQIPNLIDVQDQRPAPNPPRSSSIKIPAQNIQIPSNDGDLKTTAGEEALRHTKNIVPGILRIVTTPVLDTVGKSSWDNMRRRTQTVFRSPTRKLKDGTKASITQGGLAELMDKIQAENKLRRKAGNSPLRVTLIGHSMGAIISNEILRRYSDINFERIVYLAAACSIREFQNSVIPYMTSNRSTKFYSVGLHPYGDRREDSSFGFLAQGSLLDWIDDFASHPETRMDHTLGKINNVMRIIGTVERGVPQQVLNRIHFNAFPYLPKQDGRYPYPRTHGSFNDLGNVHGTDVKGRDLQFWMEDYWQWRQPK